MKKNKNAFTLIEMVLAMSILSVFFVIAWRWFWDLINQLKDMWVYAKQQQNFMFDSYVLDNMMLNSTWTITKTWVVWQTSSWYVFNNFSWSWVILYYRDTKDKNNVSKKNLVIKYNDLDSYYSNLYLDASDIYIWELVNAWTIVWLSVKYNLDNTSLSKYIFIK